MFFRRENGGAANRREKRNMKKLTIASLLALGLVLTSQQQAPAWVNFKGGIGLNFEFSSGGNSLLWGAVRGAQPSGPQFHGYAPPMDHYQPMDFYAQPSFQHGPQHDYYGPAAPHFDHFVPPAPQPGWAPPAPQPAGSGLNQHRPSVQPAHYYYPTSYYGGSNNYYPAYWYGQ